jgi:hypothetical protein
MSNVEILQKAGIILVRVGKLSKKDVETIESLSKEEIKAWVQIKEQLGPDFIRRNVGRIMI